MSWKTHLELEQRSEGWCLSVWINRCCSSFFMVILWCDWTNLLGKNLNNNKKKTVVVLMRFIALNWGKTLYVHVERRMLHNNWVTKLFLFGINIHNVLFYSEVHLMVKMQMKMTENTLKKLSWLKEKREKYGTKLNFSFKALKEMFLYNTFQLCNITL